MPCNAAGEICGAFLWRAGGQSGFDDSAKRTQSDRKPNALRFGLDF